MIRFHRGRGTVRKLIIILSVLLMAGFVWFAGSGSFRMGKLRDGEIWSEKTGHIYAGVTNPRGRLEKVAAWWDEAAGGYVLFLPSFVQPGDSIKLYVKGMPRVRLDGVTIKSSKRYQAPFQGVYDLEILGQHYDLKFMYGRNISTLFVDMEEDVKEELTEEPYKSYAGLNYTFVDSAGREVTDGAVEAMRVRGNTTADRKKKPFQLTLRSAADFEGMGQAVTWNLLSNYADDSHLRNMVVYTLAREAGLEYSPESCFVDLYFNGEYQGLYQLCEKVEIGNNRVDIPDLSHYTAYKPAELSEPVEAGDGRRFRGYQDISAAEDITGGYLLEIERPSRIEESPSYFVTRGGQPVTVKSPKYADYSEVIYMADRWQAFEDALFSEDGRNPADNSRYTDYIDEVSFAKKYLIEELSRNYDASSTSQYFYKNSDETDPLIYAGPAWDYDMSLGNPRMHPEINQHYISSVSPYGEFASLQMDEFSIWYHLCKHEDFRELVKEQYREVFLPLIREMENSGIDRYALMIRNSAVMDYCRWNKSDLSGETPEESFLTEVAGVKKFLKAREGYFTGLWIDGRENVRVYLDGGLGDMYVAYIENLAGEMLEVPPEPRLDGYRFVCWLDGYTNQPYFFSMPCGGEPLYLKAEYRSLSNNTLLRAGD